MREGVNCSCDSEHVEGRRGRAPEPRSRMEVEDEMKGRRRRSVGAKVCPDAEGGIGGAKRNRRSAHWRLGWGRKGGAKVCPDAGEGWARALEVSRGGGNLKVEVPSSASA